MTEQLHALADFRIQLQNYNDGARLKIAAMNEVKESIQSLGLSQRQFVAEARRLGYPLSSAQSLSNWIKCTHIPSPINVDYLMDALLGVLRENGHTGEPWKNVLRESSFLHSHTLENFRRDAQNLEQAKELFEATIAWLNMTEFPPSTSGWSGLFVPLTREQGVQCLDILRQVHFGAAQETTAPRAVEHQLLAAKAAIILSHLLNVTGRFTDALEAATEGGYVLGAILDKYPQWRESPLEGYMPVLGETITLAELVILAQIRKAAALHALSHLARTAEERADYHALGQHTLVQAGQQGSRLPSHSVIAPDAWRARAAIALDEAQSLQDLQKAEEHAQCAQYYAQRAPTPSRLMLVQEHLALLAQMEANARLGQLELTHRLLTRAEELEHDLAVNKQLLPGPAQQMRQRRALAAYWLAHAETHKTGSPRWREFAHRWRDTVVAGLKLAHDAGLYNQGRRFRMVINQVAPEYRRILAAASASAI